MFPHLLFQDGLALGFPLESMCPPLRDSATHDALHLSWSSAFLSGSAAAAALSLPPSLPPPPVMSSKESAAGKLDIYTTADMKGNGALGADTDLVKTSRSC